MDFGLAQTEAERRQTRIYLLLLSILQMKGKTVRGTVVLTRPEWERRKQEKVLENPQVIKTPVVRNGKQSTIGYQPDVWKGWN